MGHPGVAGITVGHSLDEPGRAAIVIYVNSLPRPGSFPAELEGVRTRIAPVAAPQSSSQFPAVAQQEVERVTAVKEQWAEQLLRSNHAIFGVGVGSSDDSPGEAALVLFVEKGSAYSPPAVLDGARVKVYRAERFRSWGWNEHQQPRACQVPPRRSLLNAAGSAAHSSGRRVNAARHSSEQIIGMNRLAQ
jgi:hypothetical protein